MGEILYILRPSIYAWCIHYVDKKTREESEQAGTENAGGEEEGKTERNERGTRRPVNKAYMIALAVSLAVELLSLSLTDAALRKAREEVEEGVHGGGTGAGAGGGGGGGEGNDTSHDQQARTRSRSGARMRRQNHAFEQGENEDIDIMHVHT